MYALGIVAKTRHKDFKFSVWLNGCRFFVKNADEVSIKEDEPVLVQYEPADQFCAVVPLEKVQRALAEYDHVGADDYAKHPYPLVS